MGDRLYAFLQRRCPSSHDAEDLVQETFFQAWRSLPRYRPELRFTTWLFTIAVRVAASNHRKRTRATVLRLVGDDTTHVDDPLINACEREDAGNLWKVADRVLDAEQRTALWLRYAEGMSVRDVAEVLGRTPVGVRVLVHRARQLLIEHEAASTPSATPACAG